MASTSNQGPNPNRGRKRRRPSTAAVVAGTVGKVLGTFLLICVITGAILLCFAAVYIKTVIIPQAHLEANFVMNQTSTIYYKDYGGICGAPVPPWNRKPPTGRL